MSVIVVRRDTVKVVVRRPGPMGPPGLATAPAGGVLSGNYPNPGFAVDMATQAELNAEAAARVAVQAAVDAEIANRNSAVAAARNQAAAWAVAMG